MKNFAIYPTEEQKMGIDQWMRKSDNRVTREIYFVEIVRSES